MNGPHPGPLDMFPNRVFDPSSSDLNDLVSGFTAIFPPPCEVHLVAWELAGKGWAHGVLVVVRCDILWEKQ